MLEVGIAWISAAEVWSPRKISSRHLIVEEHVDLRNGRYVADNKENFNFGTSELVPMAALAGVIIQALEGITAGCDRTYLIGHSIHHDVHWLEGLGIDLDRLALTTCDIGKAHQGKKGHLQLTRLAAIMDHHGINQANLHNAANDAYYSLEVGLRMMEVEDELRYGELERDGLLL